MEQLHKDASCGTLGEQESGICFTSCIVGEKSKNCSDGFFIKKKLKSL